MTIANQDWLKVEAEKIIRDATSGRTKLESAGQRAAYIRMVDERDVKDLLSDIGFNLKPSEIKALAQSKRAEYNARFKTAREQLNNGKTVATKLLDVGIDADDWSEEQGCFMLSIKLATKLTERGNLRFISEPKAPFPLNGDRKATRTAVFTSDDNERTRDVLVNCLSEWHRLAKPRGKNDSHVAEDGQQGGATNVVDAMALIAKDGESFVRANFQNDDAFRALQTAHNEVIRLMKLAIALRNEAHPAAKTA